MTVLVGYSRTHGAAAGIADWAQRIAPEPAPTR